MNIKYSRKKAKWPIIWSFFLPLQLSSVPLNLAGEPMWGFQPQVYSMPCWRFIATVRHSLTIAFGIFKHKMLFARKHYAADLFEKFDAKKEKIIFHRSHAILPSTGQCQVYIQTCQFVITYRTCVDPVVNVLHIQYTVSPDRSMKWITKLLDVFLSYIGKSAWHNVQPVCTSCLCNQMFL